MDKMRMESVDMTSQNIEKIGAMFPNCITEAVGENGKLKKAINFEVLKQMLSDDVLDGDEAYEFTWVGKKAAILEASKPIRKTLRPYPKESKDWDTTENLYIEGDNLEVLKLLQESYLEKVKMIYIDPPYNTGNDFIYNDDFKMTGEEYADELGTTDEDGNRMFKNTNSNGRFHSDWCTMMYSRLVLARNLLSNRGAIFISIDDGEQGQLRKMCDEVFGEENFAACLPWQSRLSMQNDTDLSINHEYILVYAKKRRFENRRLKESNVASWYSDDSFVFRPLPLDKSKFDNPDNDPRGLWKAAPFDAPNVRPNLTYPVTNPLTGEQHLPPIGRHWRISPDKFSSAMEEGRIIFGKSGTGRPQMKSFYEEKKDFGSIDNSWFSGEKVGTTTSATKELQSLFDKAPFDTPKPTSLIKKLCSLGFLDDGDVILDFFSGSASTAHAVMQLNADDNGHRKYIMVQIPEEVNDASREYRNICEIGKERIRRAGEKIKSETGADIDYGFRVLKLDDSNMTDVYYAAEEYDQGMLPMFESNIKPDRTDLDLLFSCLLEWGLPLSMPHKSEQIEECTVHTYDPESGDKPTLIACFNENIPDSVIKAIAKRQPLRAVFRDSSFAGSPAKINVTEVFKLLAPDTRVKVI